MKYLIIMVLLSCSAYVNAQDLMSIKYMANTFMDRRIRIATPSNYSSDIKFNTIYVLDSDYMFELVVAMVGYLQYNESIPPTAVIAIDYSEPEKRIDLGFNINGFLLTQAGEHFYEYIDNYLIPAIDEAIPTTVHRVVIGHSYSATYLLEFLKRQNNKFKGYLLFAPECSEQALASYNYKPDYMKDKSVYMIIGDRDIESRIEFATKLREVFCSKPEIKVDLIIAKNSSHMDVIADQMANILKLYYANYWSTDKIYESNSFEGMSLRDIYTTVNACNLSFFQQPVLLSSSNIIYYLGGAITSKDTYNIEFFTRLFESQLNSVENLHPNVLSTFADLNAKIKNYALAEKFMTRALDEYNKQNLDHQTWYPRQTFALNILAPIGKLDQAWDMLESGKSIFIEDSVAFSYYQAILSEKYDYRVDEAKELLVNAILSPQVLEDNFISIDEARELLEKLSK